MPDPRLYIEDPHFKMSRKYLSDETYREAIESFVIVDVDALFINRANKTIFLLAQRKAKPMQGIWLVGGRIFAGERPEEAMQRVLKRETSLEMPTDRYQFLSMNRYMWRDRQQEPQDKGSDNLCYTYAIELTPEERTIASNHLDPHEYDTSVGLQEFDARMLKEHGVHQAIIDLHDQLFAPENA